MTFGTMIYRWQHPPQNCKKDGMEPSYTGKDGYVPSFFETPCSKDHMLDRAQNWHAVPWHHIEHILWSKDVRENSYFHAIGSILRGILRLFWCRYPGKTSQFSASYALDAVRVKNVTALWIAIVLPRNAEYSFGIYPLMISVPVSLIRTIPVPTRFPDIFEAISEHSDCISRRSFLHF